MTTKELINVLEDTAALLQKTQVNIKKCPKTRLTKGYVEARIKCIDEYWTTFRESHQQLVKITTKEQKQTLNYFVNEDFYTYEDLYLVLLADLQDLLSTINASTKLSTSLALLATATVLARNEHNHTVVLRALVDQGSQASFISEKATQLLKLTRRTARGSIIGVGSTKTNVNHVVQLRIGSRLHSSFEINIEAYVMSKHVREESFLVLTQIRESVKRILWEIDTDKKRKLTREEKLCEAIYEKNQTRTKEGRYVFMQSIEANKRTTRVHLDLKLDGTVQALEGLTSQFNEFTNLQELIQVITYCRRFLNFKRSLENLEKNFTTKE
ncbi:hypothetical protein SFRURICE_001562 [Spodoptera frugiperda]|nr:hypothetical protein SFRURICE_001562 [Spodoptera frugiperda]